jgi:hypothetical protein
MIRGAQEGASASAAAGEHCEWAGRNLGFGPGNDTPDCVLIFMDVNNRPSQGADFINTLS